MKDRPGDRGLGTPDGDPLDLRPHPKGPSLESDIQQTAHGIQFLGRQHVKQRVGLPALLYEVRFHRSPLAAYSSAITLLTRERFTRLSSTITSAF